MAFDQGALVAYVFSDESADGYLWRGHPGVVEIVVGEAAYDVLFHRSPTSGPVDEQFLAPLQPTEFAARIAAIDHREHPTEVGRRLPPPPPGAARADQ